MRASILYLTTILFCVLLSACAQETTHYGETRMSSENLLTVQLQEEIYSPDVTAVVTLQDPLVDATLWIDGVQVGTFNNQVTSFKPSVFGDVACEVRHKSGVETDTVTMEIETGYIRYNSDGINGDLKDPIENGEVILTPSNVTFGSNDMIWAYNVRVPKDGKITFDYESILLQGATKAEFHFRLADYKDRFDLYPDEPYVAKHIDTEVKKWLDAPLELGHGMHTVYVCPSLIADKTWISVIHSSDFSSGTFSANYASIMKWPND